MFVCYGVMNLITTIIFLIHEINKSIDVKLETKADSAEMRALKEIREYEEEIGINHEKYLKENKEIEAIGFERKLKEEDDDDCKNKQTNFTEDILAPVYTLFSTCMVLAFLCTNYDKVTTEMLSWIIIISIVSLIGSLGFVKYGLEMKGKNNMKRFLRKFKRKDDQDGRNRWNDYVWIPIGIFTAIMIFSHILLYLEIAFWFDLNSYLNKLLWNAIALETTVVILDLLQDTRE
nr:12393_t:CDS:2 [Entrophospora candida]